MSLAGSVGVLLIVLANVIPKSMRTRGGVRGCERINGRVLRLRKQEALATALLIGFADTWRHGAAAAMAV